MGEDERTKLADRIDAWSPSQGVLTFIARERRMLADALRSPDLTEEVDRLQRQVDRLKQTQRRLFDNASGAQPIYWET